MKRTSWRTFLSGGAVTLLSGHARASLTATGDNFTNRSAPKGGDQSSKGQPEAAKDNPPRTPKAQRLLSLTLREQHSRLIMRVGGVRHELTGERGDFEQSEDAPDGSVGQPGGLDRSRIGLGAGERARQLVA
jgi:hypothetical protein